MKVKITYPIMRLKTIYAEIDNNIDLESLCMSDKAELIETVVLGLGYPDPLARLENALEYGYAKIKVLKDLK